MLGYAVSTSNFEMYTSSRSQNSTFSDSSSFPRISFCCCSRYVLNYRRELYSKYSSMHVFSQLGKRQNLIFKILIPGNNEVGMWNLESRYRQKVLWASSSPIFSTTPDQCSVSAIYPIQTSNNQGCVTTNLVTAGTDMRIRFWDLEQPNNSEIVSFGATEIVDRSSISYK